MKNSVVERIYFSDEFCWFRDYYKNKALIEWKGSEYEYGRNLGLLRIINFASNKLTGEIPEEITPMLEVIVLNLSRNNLAGVMQEKTVQLKQLPSLDFSENRLSGRIPTSGDLNFLSHLNLSYNNLPGRIPSSTQLQSFDASAFNGNPALCGAPITQKCPDTSKSTS
uniref:Leucine-rich repeat-containing N-terminal plant-type domain-containing protein n=1 Tax=Populus trichocarpa TaxID=3694 RepID=A0A2K1XH14_POPTR